MADRDPKHLSEKLYSKFVEWDRQMQENDIDYILTCTKRTQAEQNALWLQGRGNPCPKVTWTLNSKHLTGDAFDFCIIVNGKCDWAMNCKDHWNKAVEIGKSLGLSQVIGKDGRVKEFAHLQLA